MLLVMIMLTKCYKNQIKLISIKLCAEKSNCDREHYNIS